MTKTMVFGMSCRGLLYPLHTLPEEETQPIGLWGQRHLKYIKEYRKSLYLNLLTSGKLNSYLTEINTQAEDLMFSLTKQIAENENVTEKLKEENAMLWVGRMNEIQSRVREIIYAEIIYI